MTWIQTKSGCKFDLANPCYTKVRINDIADSLSKLCRFNGQCEPFYSVAQHSVLVMNLLPKRFKKHGLLHDAHEAYMGDITTPLKMLLPGIKQVEDRLIEAVSKKFGLVWTAEAKTAVEVADKIALASEKASLFQIYLDWKLNDLPKACVSVQVRSIAGSRKMFFDAWKEITM